MYGFVLIAEWAWAIYSMAKLELSSHQEPVQGGRWSMASQATAFWSKLQYSG